MIKLYFIVYSYYFVCFFAFFFQRSDKSLTISEYQNLGLANVNSDWNFDDYSKALESLEKLKEKDRYALPVRTSPKSIKYFRKIIGFKTFIDNVNKNTSLKDISVDVKNYTYLYQKIIILYYLNGSTTQYYNSELISFYILGLKEQSKEIRILKEIVAPQKESVKIDVLKMPYSNFVKGITIELGKINVYQIDDLVRLSQTLKLEVLKNKAFLLPAYRSDIVKILTLTIQKTQNPFLKENCNEIIKQI